MSKPFLTYEQQLEKLSTEKELNIPDLSFATNALKNIGYFSLIGGYKTPFINPTTRIYVNTSFDDIFALYKFDQALRKLTFKYLCEIEQKIRQQISYSFCSVYGEQQQYYLSKKYYHFTKANEQSVDKLISILDFYANKDQEHKYLVHQRDVYHNVPLWCIMNTLTLGQTSKMYSLLPFKIQSLIAKSYTAVNERTLEQYLKTLTLFRNVCAHNERLYNLRLHNDFPDSVLHKKLGISKSGNKYNYGKRDYFGLVISFRYLLSKSSFVAYKKSLKHLISLYCQNSNRISQKSLISIMGFPENWDSITRFKI